MRMISTILLPFDTWDFLGKCPHCESEEIEIDLQTDEWVCINCEQRSASFITDGLEDESWWINNMDRFDFLALFDSERVGGDDPGVSFEDEEQVSL